MPRSKDQSFNADAWAYDPSAKSSALLGKEFFFVPIDVYLLMSSALFAYPSRYKLQ